MALPKRGLGGFSDRIFSWKQGVKQWRKRWVQEKSPNKEACGEGKQTASEVVKAQPLGHLKWNENTLQRTSAQARIRSSNRDFPGIVSGTVEQAEIAFYQTNLSSWLVVSFQKSGI